MKFNVSYCLKVICYLKAYFNMMFGQPSVIFPSTFWDKELVVCSGGQREAPDWCLLNPVEPTCEKLVDNSVFPGQHCPVMGQWEEGN